MIHTFPSITADSCDFSLASNTASHTSPYDKTTQTLELPGARWLVSLMFDSMREDEAREMAAFAVKLRGEAGRFYLYDMSHPNPRGNPQGSPVVDGAGQTGDTINIRGWTASATGLLKPGDYIGFNDELHMVTAQVDADGTGDSANVPIEPPIRTAPADGATITTDKPKAVFRLIDDGQARWTAKNQRFNRMTLTAIEAFT